MDKDALGCADDDAVRSEGLRGGMVSPNDLGCQGIFIGRRLDEEGGRLPPVPEGVGTEESGLIKDEDDEARVLGEGGLGRPADEVDDCGSCRALFAIIGLMSVKLDVRGSRLVLEFRGDPACSGTLEAILSR